MKRTILRNRRRVATRRSPLKFLRAPNVEEEKAEGGPAVALPNLIFPIFAFRISIFVIWC
jgi:hypothetical protein